MAGMSQGIGGIGSLLLNGGLSAASALNPAFAVAGAAAPLFQGILGLTQGARARQISRRNPRPQFAIPGAATNALNDQRNLAMGQAPGISNAMNQLAQSQAGSIAAMQDSGGGMGERLAAMAMLDRNAGASALDLGAMQEDWKARQMGNLINQQNDYAKWQAQKWDYDVNQPYQEAQAKAAAMNDAANSNIHNALEVAGGLVGQTLKQPSPAGQGSGAGARKSTPRIPVFDPNEGAAQEYDFDLIESENARKRAGFNPDQPGSEYDLDAIQAEYDSKGKASPAATEMDRRLAEEKKAAFGEMYKGRTTPIGSKPVGSLMPELGSRGRRTPYRREIELPELDSLGYRRVK